MSAHPFVEIYFPPCCAGARKKEEAKRVRTFLDAGSSVCSHPPSPKAEGPAETRHESLIFSRNWEAVRQPQFPTSLLAELGGFKSGSIDMSELRRSEIGRSLRARRSNGGRTATRVRGAQAAGLSLEAARFQPVRAIQGGAILLIFASSDATPAPRPLFLRSSVWRAAKRDRPAACAPRSCRPTSARVRAKQMPCFCTCRMFRAHRPPRRRWNTV